MNRLIRWTSFSAWLCAILLFCTSAGAQQNTQSSAQQMRATKSAEKFDAGTVVSFTENSSTAPLGPHVVIQTTSGQRGCPSGGREAAERNHLTLAAGDSVRVVGENVTTVRAPNFSRESYRRQPDFDAAQRPRPEPPLTAHSTASELAGFTCRPQRESRARCAASKSGCPSV